MYRRIRNSKKVFPQYRAFDKQSRTVFIIPEMLSWDFNEGSSLASLGMTMVRTTAFRNDNVRLRTMVSRIDIFPRLYTCTRDDIFTLGGILSPWTYWKVFFSRCCKIKKSPSASRRAKSLINLFSFPIFRIWPAYRLLPARLFVRALSVWAF